MMTHCSNRFVEFWYHFAMSLADVSYRLFGRVLLCLLASVNVVISVFFVSYFILRRSLYGVMCWDGSRIMLSYKRGCLLAIIGLSYINSFEDFERTFAPAAASLYDIKKDKAKIRRSSVILRTGVMPFNLLYCPMSILSRSKGIIGSDVTSKPLCIKKTKSVTFNENVEVRLIATNTFQHDKSFYMPKRETINNIPPIAARSFIEPF